ncbi:MAG: hypothetical protein HYY23_05190 [Verrucomicrobia bacterium]|nr:hypothetical protein [Verrucomicrobiota bacterium]
MKASPKFALMLMIPWLVYGQPEPVKLSIDFEKYETSTENDLTMHFVGTIGRFVQDTQIGRSGGGVIPPDRSDSEVRLRQEHFITAGSELSVSCDFNFDPAAVNPNLPQPTLTIDLQAAHVISAGLFNNRLRIVANGAERAQIPMPLGRGWHRLTVNIQFGAGPFGDENRTTVSVQKYEGQEARKISSISESIFDIDIANSARATVSFKAAKWGGTLAIDNFELSGQSAKQGEFPKFVNASASPALELRWPSIRNKAYRIEVSDEMPFGEWRQVAGPIYGTGNELSYLLSIRFRPFRFYRVREE